MDTDLGVTADLFDPLTSYLDLSSWDSAQLVDDDPTLLGRSQVDLARDSAGSDNKADEAKQLHQAEAIEKRQIKLSRCRESQKRSRERQKVGSGWVYSTYYCLAMTDIAPFAGQVSIIADTACDHHS